MTQPSDGKWILVPADSVQSSSGSAASGPVATSAAKPSGKPLQADDGSKSGEAGGADKKMFALPMRVKSVMKGKGGFTKPVKVILTSQFNIGPSGGGAALTTVNSLSPLGVQDYSSFAAVYDLVRTEKIEVMVSLTTSAPINGVADWGIAWDPANNGPYSSLTDVMSSLHHVGPVRISGGGVVTSPALRGTVDGFMKMSVKMPTGSNRVTADGGAANLVGGGWMATGDTTSLIGWLKPYVPGVGAGITTTLVLWVKYFVEFRSRT